ncbi:brct domain-containing protein [Seiridium cupressi]
MPGLNAKPKPIFKDVVVAIVGDIGVHMTEANLGKWMKIRSGRFSANFDDSVTHLLATDDQYKKKVARVKKAMKGKIEILTPDWLEESMAQNKKLALNHYSHQRRQRIASAKKRRSQQMQKCIKQGESYVNTNKYHIYSDKSGFYYQVTLSRKEGERFINELWESNAQPHLYFFACRYFKKANAPALRYRHGQNPGTLERELRQFCHAFQKKTGVNWDNRMSEAREGIVQAIDGQEGSGYRYTIPIGGKPVGLVHNKVYDLSEGLSICGNDEPDDIPGQTNKASEKIMDEATDTPPDHTITTQVHPYSNGTSSEAQDLTKDNIAVRQISTANPLKTPRTITLPTRGKPSLAVEAQTAKMTSPSKTNDMIPFTPPKSIPFKKPTAPNKRKNGNSVGIKRNFSTFEGSTAGSLKKLPTGIKAVDETKLMQAKTRRKPTRAISKGKTRVSASAIKASANATIEDSGYDVAFSSSEDDDDLDPDADRAHVEAREKPQDIFATQPAKRCRIIVKNSKVEEPAAHDDGDADMEDSLGSGDANSEDSLGHKFEEAHIDKAAGVEDMMEIEDCERAEDDSDLDDEGHSSDSS